METLDKHFRALTREAFARHGHAFAALAQRWPEIVGEELARHCRPERIQWPRGSGAEAQKHGGTLVIGASPGRALDLQYEAPRIIERIAAFLGYGALASVRIVTAAGPLNKPLKTPREPGKPIPDQNLTEIPDDALRAALVRLGQGIAGSPQEK